MKPPLRACLYLTMQQEIRMSTSFLYDSRNDEYSSFLVRKNSYVE